MKHAAETLDALGVGYDARIVSAHRTPERLYAFAKGAKAEGFKVIIAGAGGAAHLPGMTASLTSLPVFGVPVESKALSGTGFALFDRADAARHSGRHARHRQGRRDQRGAAGRERLGAERSRRWPAGSKPGGRGRPPAVAEIPKDGRVTATPSPYSSPRPRSASSAAASSAGCWRWPRRGSASSVMSSAPSPDSPAFDVVHA